MDSPNQWINHYPLNNSINFDITYPLCTEVDSQHVSIVNRQSVYSRLIVRRMSTENHRELVESWSIVDRYSVDRAMNYRPSIGQYFINAPQTNIGHMSVVYKSTVGDISANCGWHIGQLSVDYQSYVNLAGESNGFPFERLSNVIMPLGKMLQCKARLLYEANRRALQTMGIVIYSFSSLYRHQSSDTCYLC